MWLSQRARTRARDGVVVVHDNDDEGGDNGGARTLSLL